MNGQQLADHIGVSYRQIDYWTSKGYLIPSNKANPGSGVARTYSDAEIAIAYMVAQLVRSGMDPASAVRIARRGASLGWSVGRLLNECDNEKYEVRYERR